MKTEALLIFGLREKYTSFYEEVKDMTLILNYEGFEHRLTKAYTNEKSGCGYYKFMFPHGYGALVLKQPGSIGYEKDLWQVQVLEYNKRRDCWQLSPMNPFSWPGCLFGVNCSDEQVRKLLKEMEDYP